VDGHTAQFDLVVCADGQQSVGLPTICQPKFVKFLPSLYDRLTMHPARIVADTIT
jgi:hypothetical protein